MEREGQQGVRSRGKNKVDFLTWRKNKVDLLTWSNNKDDLLTWRMNKVDFLTWRKEEAKKISYLVQMGVALLQKEERDPWTLRSREGTTNINTCGEERKVKILRPVKGSNIKK